MTFDSMFQPRTPSSPSSASQPAPRRTRAPKGHVTINGKVYREATGYDAARCPNSLSRIAWYKVRSNLGSDTYWCPKCGGMVRANFQESILGYWNFSVHDRADSPQEPPADRLIPENPEF